MGTWKALLGFGLLLGFVWFPPIIEAKPTTNFDSMFEKAKSTFESGKYLDAATLSWQAVRQGGGGDHQESFEFILARSFQELGLSHAAVEYYLEVMTHGGASELITESLNSVIDLVDRLPVDRFLVEHRMIGGAKYNFLPPDTQSMVRFVQGKLDFSREDKDWSEQAFSEIIPNTLPWFMMRYAIGVRELREGRPDQAIAVFKSVSEEAPKKTIIRNRALQSLGRMRYEEKDYKAALAAYESVDSSVLLWDDIFLEKAWNTFQLGLYRRALGYLHALQAPIFEHAFQPERHLLLGMILRRLCRFVDTRAAIANFREKYGKAIEHVRKGRPLEQNDTIKKAAKTKAIIRDRSQFLDQLEKELKTLNGDRFGDWKRNGLLVQLRRIYSAKLRELRSELDDRQEDALAEVAEELLYFNEQMNLLEYEIRMDEFRRSRFSDGSPPEPKKPQPALVSKVLHWKHRGEFWLDELDHYTVELESQCEE